VSGFALVELLVVVVILGLVSGLAAVYYRGGNRPLDAASAATTIADALRRARSEAIAYNRTTQVVVDAPGHRMFRADGSEASLPAGIALVFQGLLGAGNASRVVFAFATDGSSSGGTLIVTAAAREARLNVSWLTGQVRLDHVP
jgi:general secretion pathway protein H